MNLEHRRAALAYTLIVALLAFDFLVVPEIALFGQHFTALLTATLAAFHLTAGVIVAIRAHHNIGRLRWPVPYAWVVFLWLMAETSLWTQATWVWWIAPRQTPFWSQIGSRLFLIEITVWMIWRTARVPEMTEATK